MLDDQFIAEQVEPEFMDLIWENGFRHFGVFFYRYKTSFYENKLCNIIPLRIVLKNFIHSHSQKRILKKNRDLHYEYRDAFIDEMREELFDLHKKRFLDNVPDTLYSFLSEDPSKVPCQAKECDVYYQNRLIAVSYFDIGQKSISSVYAFFHPEFSKRSLGNYTLLLEIQYAIEQGKEFLYTGYAYDVPSFYDYKKTFHGLECYDWNQNWNQMERLVS